MNVKLLDPNYKPEPAAVNAGETVGTIACGAKNGVIKLGNKAKPVAERLTRVFRQFGHGVKRGWTK